MKAVNKVTVLIHCVNNENSSLKTSFEQQWGNQACQFAKLKYSKGIYFEEMFPPKKIQH